MIIKKINVVFYKMILIVFMNYIDKKNEQHQEILDSGKQGMNQF